MNVIGISAFFHDSACCLLQDGVIKFAVEEERYTRVKADASLPRHAFQACLEAAGLKVTDIDCIAYYENPRKKLARQLWSGILGDSPKLLDKLDPNYVENRIRDILGFEGPVKFFDHHLSHAASSFFFSGYESASIFTVDGVGEWATTTYSLGRGKSIEMLEEVEFPNSLGLVYSTITNYLGFEVNEGEYKVMGLAPYGKPLYLKQMEILVQDTGRGQYQLDMKYFNFSAQKRMYTDALIELFGKRPRGKDDGIAEFHTDVAKSLQVFLESILVAKTGYLFDQTGCDSLCMAGGVALNCVANSAVLRNGPFKRLFIQPAANDAGGAVGAAALAHIELTQEWPNVARLRHAYLGPEFAAEAVMEVLRSMSLRYYDCRGDFKKLLSMAVTRLESGQVLGWYQGKMEFGPRSLGARSILADPRNEDMRDRINKMVKLRETFRPFAPAVMAERVREHFDIDHPSPFMLETCQVVSRLSLPAITHVDGSARVQTVDRESNPRFHDLLSAFEELTGCPILLNTSFNIKGEPIVCTPEDAIRCWITTDIDCLIIGDYIIDRDDNNLEILKILITADSAMRDNEGAIVRDVYTFV
jgi:carbamoyltransferase